MFKVGDRVRIKVNNYYGGKTGIISNSYLASSVVQIDDLEHNLVFLNDNLEKIEEAKYQVAVDMAKGKDFTLFSPRFFGRSIDELDSDLIDSLRYSLTANRPEKKTFMSQMIQKIKDLALSETDRILRKHGFEDENGKITKTTEELMLDELVTERWKTRREEVATSIKKVEENEK